MSIAKAPRRHPSIPQQPNHSALTRWTIQAQRKSLPPNQHSRTLNRVYQKYGVRPQRPNNQSQRVVSDKNQQYANTRSRNVYQGTTKPIVNVASTKVETQPEQRSYQDYKNNKKRRQQSVCQSQNNTGVLKSTCTYKQEQSSTFLQYNKQNKKNNDNLTNKMTTPVNLQNQLVNNIRSITQKRYNYRQQPSEDAFLDRSVQPNTKSALNYKYNDNQDTTTNKHAYSPNKQFKVKTPQLTPSKQRTGSKDRRNQLLERSYQLEERLRSLRGEKTPRDKENEVVQEPQQASFSAFNDKYVEERINKSPNRLHSIDNLPPKTRSYTQVDNKSYTQTDNTYNQPNNTHKHTPKNHHISNNNQHSPINHKYSSIKHQQLPKQQLSASINYESSKQSPLRSNLNAPLTHTLNTQQTLSRISDLNQKINNRIQSILQTYNK